MRKQLLTLLFFLVSGVELVVAQERIFEKPLSPRIANYDLRAELKPEQKTVEASWNLHWWNASRDTVKELQFHLYLNAFRNERSTFIRESGGRHRSGEINLDSANWGYILIKNLAMAGGENLTTRIEYIAPDDGNKDDRTVIRVPLSRPIPPGGDIRLTCDFTSKLPRVYARTGFTEDDFYLIGQWFPKIGVWENGAWNCHQFHSNSEFYADFGVYTMELTVPKKYFVGANAVLMEKKALNDSTNLFRYRQEDVIDAVWTAYPHFKELQQTVTIKETERQVVVTYLVPPERLWVMPKYYATSEAMFNYYQEWYGAYPYPNLTIVDVPVGEEMTAGGMEYPTLVTTGSYFGWPFINKYIVPNHWLETVTFHEFGHNYFQSLVATNEFEHPWMDEGFTQYTEARASVRFAKENNIAYEMADIFGIPFNVLAYNRSSYTSRPKDGVIEAFSWNIPESFYQPAAYAKPALVLETLQRHLGDAMWNKVMRTYFERYSFKHPKPRDFYAVVNEVTGKDFMWYFDQFVNKPVTVDYQIAGVFNEEIHASRGWFGDGNNLSFTGSDASDSLKQYRSGFSVRNMGDGYFPTKILVCFADGDSIVETWDGQYAPQEFVYHGKAKIKSVHIDPDRVNLLDINWTNNSRVLERDEVGIQRYITRFLFWLQNIGQVLAVLV
ncbi:MAG TPA: M1 family metallopeptidase [bacterium]|nr:M1 family metallopeptidase [bacterium]